MSGPAVMWFRNDLRLADNAALRAAAAAGPVLAVYILDDESPGDRRMGAASRWWLHHTLTALSAKIRLVLRRGKADDVFAALLKDTKAASLHFSRDYAPWSNTEEKTAKAQCDVLGIPCRRYGGYLLHEPEAIRSGTGTPYKIFTPFARAHRAKGEPRLPSSAPQFKVWDGPVASDNLSDWRLLPTKPNWAKGFEERWRPGEEQARAQLQRFIADGLADYAEGRDRPYQDEASSRLSPRLHFGELSPAQVWHAVSAAIASERGKLDNSGEKFLSELIWRDFAYHLLQQTPGLPDKSYREEFEGLKWQRDAKGLRAWRRGLTGYPIVDAGMRELWTTGIMHNRVRMITASFLIKDLLLPWQQGERWFWDTLIDADIANNAMNWQWTAGCGPDAAPFFRVFNPITQGEKFDPKGEYVRRWAPELAKLPDKVIHRPWEASSDILRSAGVKLGETYPVPIVEHDRARDRALAAFKQLSKGVVS